MIIRRTHSLFLSPSLIWEINSIGGENSSDSKRRSELIRQEVSQDC
jgi:hypothetical protein